jgi:hypothetical protein
MVSAADGTLAPDPRDVNVACTFCGKHAAEAEHIVADRETFICNGCLDGCDDVVADKLADSWRRGPLFVLREGSGPRKIAETVRNVRDELLKGRICSVTILLPHDQHGPSVLCRQLRQTLGDIADFWEPPSPAPERALTLVA